jgi:hypothetical protein
MQECFFSQPDSGGVTSIGAPHVPASSQLAFGTSIKKPPALALKAAQKPADFYLQQHQQNPYTARLSAHAVVVYRK